MLSAHDRAVRNCPWTVGLWIRYLLAMERHRVDHGIISGKENLSQQSSFMAQSCLLRSEGRVTTGDSQDTVGFVSILLQGS